MGPILILLIGMAVVVGGVLFLRLHAFLALILGAMLVAGLTTTDQLIAARVDGTSNSVISVDADGSWIVRTGKGRTLIPGKNYLIGKSVPGENIVEVTLTEVQPNDSHLKRITIRGTLPANVNPAGLAIISASQMDAARKEGNTSVGDRVATGFGKTATSVGIIIALAAIIGECLLKCGAADRIVWSIRRLMGDQRTPQGFVLSGFVLGIPVFFDTVFYLLMPIAKGLYRRTGKHWVLYVLSIVAGATMAHSLVPPTPGPLMVASELGVSIGAMMIGGIIVGGIAAMAGYLYAVWADRRWNIPLIETTDDAPIAAEPDPATLPPLWLSILPIILPVVLIAGAAAIDFFPAGSTLPSWAPSVLFWGDKNIALTLSAIIALSMMAWYLRGSPKKMTEASGVALASAGVIILITSAGGAFGAVLQQTGIATELTQMIPAAKSALLPLAFLLTAMIRIAQGSATVAMITAVGIVSPIAAAGDLGYNLLYLALAIGCGSKPIPWMNDSGFWIIGRMSGFTEMQTLKTASAMMSLMGVVGLIVTMIGAWLFPLV